MLGSVSTRRLNSHSIASDILVDDTVEEPKSAATMHVLFHRPLLNSYPEIYHTPRETLETRDLILDWLAASSLGGDLDAAEWILLSLLSFTYVSF